MSQHLPDLSTAHQSIQREAHQDSPLSASSHIRDLRSLRRPQRRAPWLIILAAIGSLLIHTLTVTTFLLQPAWKPSQSVDTPAKMRVRFIEIALPSLRMHSPLSMRAPTNVFDIRANLSRLTKVEKILNQVLSSSHQVTKLKRHPQGHILGQAQPRGPTFDAMYKASSSNTRIDATRTIVIANMDSASLAQSTTKIIPKYVQVMPSGDTDIMSHKIKTASYHATRFEQYWAPEGESTIDSALRREREKMTATHTFHLAPGIRIKCIFQPVLPLFVITCFNGDSPPIPPPQKVYKPLFLANPPGGSISTASSTSVPSEAASETTIVPKQVSLDNTVICINARVTGGPLPKGCLSTAPLVAPATSSKLWVPTLDEIHK